MLKEKNPISEMWEGEGSGLKRAYDQAVSKEKIDLNLNIIDEEFDKICGDNDYMNSYICCSGIDEDGNACCLCNGDNLNTIIKEFIHLKLKEAYEKGKEEERKAMYSDECLIIKKETRQETLEEVEKVIKEKVILKTDDKVVDIAILLFSEDILQQLNKMKEK